MKSVDIEPFIQSSIHVFEQFQMSCQNGVQDYESHSGSDVLTMIGITGDIRGQVYIRIPVTVGLRIASAMMGGMEVTSLDQMAQSALLELSNMICGNAMITFTEKGYSLNITPPTLVVGKAIEVSGSEVHTLSSTLTINHADTVEVNVLFEK